MDAVRIGAQVRGRHVEQGEQRLVGIEVGAPERRLDLREGHDHVAVEGEIRLEGAGQAAGAAHAPDRGVLLGQRLRRVEQPQRRARGAAGAATEQPVARHVARDERLGLVAILALLERRDRRERLVDRLLRVRGLRGRREVAVVGHVHTRATHQPHQALPLDLVEILERQPHRALPLASTRS